MRLTSLLLPMLSILGVMLVLNPASGQSASAQVEQLVDRFESNLERAFSSGRDALDRFQDQHQRQAAQTLAEHLQQSEDPADQQWLAWHILALNPRHAGARAVLDEAELPLPLNEQLQFAPTQAPPPPTNGQLAALVAKAMHPANSEVIAAAQPAVATYSRRNTSAVRSFLRGLMAMRQKGQAHVVDPILAFYFPSEARRSGIQVTSGGNSWISPPDRYLLEQGLLSAEAGESKPQSGSVSRDLAQAQITAKQTATWQFPLPLGHWRMEAVVNDGDHGEAQVRSQNGKAIALAWNKGQVTLSGPGIQTKQQLPAGSHYVQVVASGAHWALVVNGAQVATGTMNQQAWRQLALNKGSQAEALRVRYLGAESPFLQASAAGLADEQLAAKSSPPADQPAATSTPEWEKELRAGLQQPVEFTFSDVPLAEVINALNLMGPINWHLDPSAEALSTLPMFLAADGMTGEQILNWFERMAGLNYRLEERGVVLIWN